MSLIAWYPLNGDLNNYGVGDMDLTITTNPTYENGKIGKGMTTGATKWTAEQTAKILNNKALTIAFWCKVTSEDTSINNRAMFFGNSSMQANDNRKFSIFNYPSLNDLHLSWQNDTKDSTILASIWTGFFPTDEWVHFCVVYDNPSIIIYKNGTQYWTGSCVSNSSTFAYETTVLRSNAGRIMNDYRFYNHALSPKEVKEISKGLILHYPLNGTSFYESATSLYSNANFATGKSVGVYNNKGNGNVVHTRVAKSSDNPIEGTDYQLHIKTSGEASPGHGGFYMAPLTSAGMTFKYHIVAKIPVGYKITWAANSRGTGVTEGWKTSVAGTDKFETYIFSLRCGDSGSFSTAGHFYLTGGSTATEDDPVEWDVAFAAVYKLNPTTIYDASGYKNNGTISGTLVSDTDSPIGQLSTKFDGTNYIKSSFSPGTSIQDYTVSYWIKPNSSSGGYAIVASNYSSPSSGFWIASNSEGAGAWYYHYSSDNKYVKSSGTLSNDTWYHCAFVHTSDGNGQWYVNGVADGSISAVGNSTITNLCIGNSYTGTDWDTTQYGSIADFRFYSTALSAADIKELYETRFNIANNGTLFCGEYVEKNSVVNITTPHTTTSWSSWFTPVAATANSCGLSGSGITFPSNTVVGDTFVLTYDIEWTQFTASGGTFRQIAPQFYANNSWSTGITSPILGGSNSTTITPKASDLLAADGNMKCIHPVTITAENQISANWYYNFRYDYSDGTGKVRIRNMQLIKTSDSKVSFGSSSVLSCADIIEDYSNMKIHSNKTILCNQIMER